MDASGSPVPVKRLLSIDPGGVGGHTGVVLLNVPETAPVSLESSWAVPDDVDGFLDWYDRVGGSLRPDIVVCEHFVNRNIKGADLTPCFIEGAVRALWRDVKLQPASGKDTAVPNDVLKRLGLYAFPGDHHHDRREASRHGVWYLMKTQHLPTLRVGWAG